MYTAYIRNQLGCVLIYHGTPIYVNHFVAIFIGLYFGQKYPHIIITEEKVTQWCYIARVNNKINIEGHTKIRIVVIDFII